MKQTANSYRRNELLQTTLAETLKQNHVQLALQVLRDLGEPTEMPAPDNVDFLIHSALLNSRREGYFHALRSLEALATPIKVGLSTKDLMPNLVDE
jgi:hypothetical protein